MNTDNIRWKQRFQNYEKALLLLKEAINLKNPDIIQKAGLIQFFEISFELSWNLMKDYLVEQGFETARSPRDSIKKAFETGLITDGHTWLQALENRNLTSHTYDETTANQVVNEISKAYFPLLSQLYDNLKGKL
jgi:nucleotidyltransferase substrate binding protein (TIGR01987 family)